MKNKKLFAILTLVCFMFTLMPVAAFAAADTTTAVQVSTAAAGTYSEELTVDATTTSGVATVFAKLETNPTTGAAYYVEKDNTVIKVAYATAGNAASFNLAPGAYTIKAILNVDGLQTLVDAANTLSVSATATNVTAADVVAKVQNVAPQNFVKTAAYVTVDAVYVQHGVAVSTYVDGSGATDTGATVLDVKADNGFASVAKVTVQLTKGAQNVVGKVPTISAPDYVTVTPANPNKTVTDAAGKIVYNVSANKAGNFKVVFSYEDAIAQEVAVKAVTDAIANMEVVKESANLINNAYADDINTGAFVKFTGADGTVIDVDSAVTTTGYAVSGAVKVTVVSQPTGSKLPADAFKLVDSSIVAGASELVVDTVPAAGLKAGVYEVKLALANGKSVTAKFEAAKFTKAIGIKFVDPATTIELNGTAPAFNVVEYDANGVTKTASVNISFNGKAWNGTNVINDEKYIGSTITVLAKDTNDRFIATTTLEVVDNGMEVVYANNTAEVGVTTLLKANVVDVKGNKVTSTTTSAVNIVVLEKPANAYVSITEGTYNNGETTIVSSFLGSVAGEYKIQTIVVADGKFVTGIETITVGGNASTFKDTVVVSIGSDKMIVNNETIALDVPAFIENDRTMLQFNVLYAFGFDVQWDGVDTITAEGNGTKVVLKIGSKVAVVNGVEAELDVAPYAVNGRTVVPVGFLTGTFGLTPNFGMGETGLDFIIFTK